MRVTREVRQAMMMRRRREIREIRKGGEVDRNEGDEEGRKAVR